MKFIISSDWHLDHVSVGVSRFDDVAHSVEESVNAAIREKANHYIFTGDLCDPDKNLTPFRAIEFAMKMAIKLANNNIDSHWLAGNHDVIEDGTGTTTLTPMRALQDITQRVYVHEKPGVTYLPYGMLLVAFPFTPISHNYDPTKLAGEILDTIAPAIVIGHLSVEGVVPGEETTQMPRGRDVYLPVGMLKQRKGPTLMVNGHYHRRQNHDGVVIPGSLARLTFGEEQHEPGYLILEW